MPVKKRARCAGVSSREPSRRRSICIFAPGLALALLLSPSCTMPRSDSGGHPLRFELPPSMERERNAYEKEVRSALERVSDFFRSSGFELPDRNIIESVIVFDSVSCARQSMAREFGAPLEGIPETFAGTVAGKRLFLVSRESYRGIWARLYPEWPWTADTYHQLIVHEVAHRAHEAIAEARFGSADAMGPAWFFEGLAVTCAGQFETDEPPLSRREIEAELGAGRTPKASYPHYGRLVRSLAAMYDMKALIARAAEPGFPETLWSR